MDFIPTYHHIQNRPSRLEVKKKKEEESKIMVIIEKIIREKML